MNEMAALDTVDERDCARVNACEHGDISRHGGVSRRQFLSIAAMGGAAAAAAFTEQASRADIFAPSIAQQKKAGAQAARQVLQKYHEVDDERARHFERIGRRLVDALPAADRNTWDFSFHVLDSKEINAFALPGGPMFMFTGLMDRVHSDDELAAVTGHEMTHVRKQHWAKAAAKQAERSVGLGLLLGLTHAGQGWQLAAGALNTVVGLKYSRNEEDEADAGGLQNMVAAGFNAQGMLDLFHTLETAASRGGHLPAFLSDHPLTAERIKKTQQRIARMRR
jgi:beta-barrel assembly-enhancing protease